MKKAGETKTACKGRLCFDYRRINSYIKAKHFPLANVKNFFDRASRYKIFCVIDIKNAFLNIPLTERAKQYLAIITPFGCFLPQRTPFGLKTSPSAFCYALNLVIGDLEYVQFYMDDLLLGGVDHEDLLKNLKTVLKRLAEYNLKIQLSKTKFYVKEIKVLGVIFSAQGKRIDPDKIKAIDKFDKIDTLKKTQTFLGMLAFLSSCIPHFSTSLYPIYSLLKDQKNKKFTLTVEAMESFYAIKKYLKQLLMCYHPDFDRLLYLACDASQVGIGAFLYQVYHYPKTEQGRNKMLEDLGFEPEQNNTVYLLPGVSPGKNTPLVTTFAKDENAHVTYDAVGSLEKDLTMTEKIERLEDKYVFHVRPISFYSKCFTDSQVKSYSTMEKEFLAMMLSIINYRDYLEAAPITFILSDNQPILWALKHQNDCVKLSRWLLKLFEFPISIVLTHVAGSKNAIADFLSRLYVVPNATKTSNFGPRSAQHITPLFAPLSVVSKEDIKEKFFDDVVTPCSLPDLCHLNVNNFLYRNLGPFNPQFSCLDEKPAQPTVKKLYKDEPFGFQPNSLQKYLTHENLFNEQRKDVQLERIIDKLENDHAVGRYFIRNDILCKNFPGKEEEGTIVVPSKLIPFVLAIYHFQTHAGAKKMLLTIQRKYYWKEMRKDIREFCAGCVLCSIYKTSSQGKVELGTPRKILHPGHTWQIDICSGLVKVKGQSSFLCMIDMYTGYAIPVALKGETTEDVARVVEQYIIKPFGPPIEISSDNARNLGGGPMKKLCAFYGIKHRQTIPYSPISHGLVESANRYITQLVRIFSDQFQANWPDVLTIAALINNSVPRQSLNNHSPYYLMFLREPFGHNTIENESFLDVEDFVKHSLNDRNFARLFREYLLKFRDERNKKKKLATISFPIGTFVYVKDLRPKIHKKLKPVYFKIPQRVITEYKGVVYSKDFLGRVHRHSKNNLKRANERSVALFGNLPEDIKIALGGEFTESTWNEIRKNKQVSNYLQDTELQHEPQIVTRQRLPSDTHALEQGGPEQNDTEIALEDTTLINDLEETEVLEHLKALHKKTLLTAPELSLSDINRLYRDSVSDEDPTQIANELPELEENTGDIEKSIQPSKNNFAEVHPDNILPEGTKRHVRFNLPVTKPTT